MTLNCIIVDDNSTQRLSALRLITNHPSLNLIGKFASALEAKKFLLSNSIDLIIMEVNLPALDGFELLDSYDENPELKIPYVIISSEDTSQAIKAFEYNVVDYLTKPTTKTRFNEAVSKTVLQAKMKENFQDYDGEHIFVKSNLKKRKIYINEIKWIEALGDYVKLITNNKSFVILSTMKAFENELPKGLFLRIHKSYIVNLKKVERYDSRHVEIEKMKLPLSRTRKAQLTQALDVIVD
ncbi:LytTR family DNA-binding domain-containing protein [Flavobacteriaceae bacterium]|nr:LytTR family DNA-binding domain-containing protein [Flavobacteriaceae bacterium]